jgi:hypothetical protein
MRHDVLDKLVVRRHTGMPLPLSSLENRLSGFTERVAASLTYESALSLLADIQRNREVSYEVAEPEGVELAFMWEVLSHEECEGSLAARILTHVCDDSPKGRLGSAWTPLCGGGWLFADGTFKQHEMGNLAADREEHDDV